MPKNSIKFDDANGVFKEVLVDDSGTVVKEIATLTPAQVTKRLLYFYAQGTLDVDGNTIDAPNELASVLKQLGDFVSEKSPPGARQKNLQATYGSSPLVVYVIARYSMGTPKESYDYALSIWKNEEFIQTTLVSFLITEDPSSLGLDFNAGMAGVEESQGLATAAADANGKTPGDKTGDPSGTADIPGGVKGGVNTGAPGGTNPDGTGDTPNPGGGDPLILFSGAFHYQATDIEVAGRGLHFSFTRTYINQMVYKGPLGYQWDHSYNLWLREAQERRADGTLLNIVYRSTGALREDAYTQITDAPTDDDPPDLETFSDAVFEGPPGFFDRLFKTGGGYVLEMADGTRVEYGANLFAERIIDSNSNTLDFKYTDNLLTEIRDPVGKRFTIRYDELNRISTLRDETGAREVRYFYSDNGDLEEVDLVLGTFISGVDYRYSGPDQRFELQHNLTHIIAPNGECVLEQTYGQETGDGEFNRVIWQRSAEGEFAYEYGWVTEDAGDPGSDPINAALTFTKVQYPNGHIIEHWFSRVGLPVRRAEIVLSATGILEPLIARYRYNEDGLLIEQIRANGRAMKYLYHRQFWTELHNGSPPPNERLKFGQLLRTVESAAPGLGETRLIVTRFEYGPMNRLAMVRGPFYADLLLKEFPNQATGEARFEYDNRGNLIRTSSIGDTVPVEFEYDAHGSPTATIHGSRRDEILYFDDVLHSGCVRETIRDATGIQQRSRFLVDDLGRVTRVTSHFGAITDTEWTEFDVPSRILLPEVTPAGPRPQIQYEYDKMRRPVRITSSVFLDDGTPHPEAALVRNLKYDAYGRLIEESTGSLAEPRLRVTTATYNRAGKMEKVTDARGTITHFQYDERLQIIAVTRAFGTPEAITIRKRLGRVGEVTHFIDGGGNTTRYVYDGFQRLHKRITPDNETTEFEYDAAGRQLRARLLDKTLTVWSDNEVEYDAKGRVLAEIAHLFVPGQTQASQPARRSKTYDALDRLTSVTNALGATWTQDYDGADRIILTRDPEGNEVHFSYDDTARTVTTLRIDNGTIAESFRKSIRFDARGNAVEMTGTLGEVTKRTYDSRGLPRTTTRPDGHQSTTEYDIFGRLRISEDLGTTTAYDANDNQVGYTTSAGGTTRWEYDRHNRPTRAVDPNGFNSTWEYDPSGRVIRAADANGVVRIFSYTPGGRLHRASADTSAFLPPDQEPLYRPDNVPDSEVEYSPMGAPLRLRSGNHECRYTHDSFGRVLEESCNGKLTRYTYDLNGELASLTYPSGRQLRWERSPLGLIKAIHQTSKGANYPGSVASPNTRTIAELKHIGHRLKHVRFSNGATANYTYGADARVIATDWSNAAGSTICSERSTHGANGELLTWQFDQHTTRMQYDDLLRMTEADSHSYTLDANGNRTQADDVAYRADASDRYLSIGDQTCIYDRTGNLIRRGSNTFRYDALGRLTGCTHNGRATIFQYDPASRLEQISSPDGVRQFRYANWKAIEWTRNGALECQIVPLVNPNQIAEAAASQTEQTPLFDLMDSVRGWISKNGLHARTHYDPFGTVLNREPGEPAPIRFAGYWQDDTSGLYLSPVRAYDPDSGRFVQPDPSGLRGGSNAYLFAGHAPGSYTDYFGLEAATPNTKTNWGTAGLGLVQNVTLGAAIMVGMALLNRAQFLSRAAAAKIGLGLMAYFTHSNYTKYKQRAIDAGFPSGAGTEVVAGVSAITGILGAPELAEWISGKDLFDAHVLNSEELGDRAATVGSAGVLTVAGGLTYKYMAPPKAPTQAPVAATPVETVPAFIKEATIILMEPDFDVAQSVKNFGAAHEIPVIDAAKGAAKGITNPMPTSHGGFHANGQPYITTKWGPMTGEILARFLVNYMGWAGPGRVGNGSCLTGLPGNSGKSFQQAMSAELTKMGIPHDWFAPYWKLWWNRAGLVPPTVGEKGNKAPIGEGFQTKDNQQ